MKLHFMKENALVFFKANIENYKSKYMKGDNSWVYEEYKRATGEKSPFEEFKYNVSDFKLKILPDAPEQTDCDNVIILHSALKNLTPTEAADERFWAGLAHSEFFNYVKYRAKLTEENLTSKKIKTHFYFGFGKRRSFITNALARLWWVGHLIYDKNKTDPYEGIEALKSDFTGKVLTLFSSNYTSNPKITRAVLKSFVKIEKKGIKISREQFREILRYVNILGGIILLDYLTEEELMKRIINHFFEVNKDLI